MWLQATCLCVCVRVRVQQRHKVLASARSVKRLRREFSTVCILKWLPVLLYLPPTSPETFHCELAKVFQNAWHLHLQTPSIRPGDEYSRQQLTQHTHWQINGRGYKQQLHGWEIIHVCWKPVFVYCLAYYLHYFQCIFLLPTPML